MTKQLKVIAGPDKGRSFPLGDADVLVVGRGHASGARLSDPHVSRTHCQIKSEGEDVLISDLGSAAGTLLNGKRIIQEKLRPGDILQLGESRLALLVHDANEEQTLLASPVPPEPVATAPLPAAGKRATQTPAPSSRSAVRRINDLSGTTLARYEVGPVLATGRVSIVFRARDLEDGQEAALKVLRPEQAGTEEDMQRFIRAMKTVGALRHPNLVTVLAAGKSEGLCWVAMELVEGETLRQAMHRLGVGGRMSWRQAFRVALYLGQALDYAHQHQIIHRNITPRHVLIRSHDKLVKLGDLMLAKAMEGRLARQITQPDQVLGDLAYLSPEQTHGQANVDARSDIYGLGATLYVMLTGKAPFEAGTTAGLVRLIREGKLKPPRHYQLSIPGPVEGLVLKMMARDPDSRFQTAGELLAELDRIANVLGA